MLHPHEQRRAAERVRTEDEVVTRTTCASEVPSLGAIGLAQNTSISLDDHFTGFLSHEVSSGRYRSASEVVRAGLRLLEDQETQMSALPDGLAEGEVSGQAEPFDFDTFVTDSAPSTPCRLSVQGWEFDDAICL